MSRNPFHLTKEQRSESFWLLLPNKSVGLKSGVVKTLTVFTPVQRRHLHIRTEPRQRRGREKTGSGRKKWWGGFGFQPREEGECVGRGFTDLGEQRGKNVPERRELSFQNFYPWLSIIFLNFFCRVLEGENLQTKSTKPNITSRFNRITRFVRIWISSTLHCGRRRMSVLSVGKDLKHQCDWKSTETHTHWNMHTPEWLWKEL